jgi:LacI family transcriptional regulator
LIWRSLVKHINNTSMTHRFPIKEISAQSGLSTATIDRALNGRAHVSPQTRARVVAAIAELEQQEGQMAARGRRLFIDIVVEAPDRFCREITKAVHHVLPQIAPAVVRPRFEMREVMGVAQTVAVLARIAKRGSDGVCLKARDVPEVRQAIAGLVGRGIPVVTIFTDCLTSGRTAYAGLDNERAGRTAARLVSRVVSRGVVLATLSRNDFQGEDARLDGFRTALGDYAPHLEVRMVQDTSGLNQSTAQLVEAVASQLSDVAGVYSMGGGNRAIQTTLARLGLAPRVYVAHDLDDENVDLLAQGRLDFVLYHDLAQDMTRAFRNIMAAHRLAAMPLDGMSDIQIVVADNVPASRGAG